jgi:hypothetical protein
VCLSKLVLKACHGFLIQTAVLNVVLAGAEIAEIVMVVAVVAVVQ